MIDMTLGSLCCGLVLILMAALVWQVVSRYALNAPSSVTEEILRYGVIWMSLLGAAAYCWMRWSRWPSWHSRASC